MFSVVIVATIFAVAASSDLTSGDALLSDMAKKTEVCYSKLGCFNSKPPFDNTHGVLPQSPKELKTAFTLYTRAKRTGGDLLDYEVSSTISKSGFNGSRPTKVIIHGVGTDAKIAWVVEMTKTFLDMGDFNVITVDWGRGAHLLKYDQAVANIRLVAAQLKAVVDLLQSQVGLKLADLHLIGHSLGAHVSGYAGLLLGGKVGRISGLDPAEPDFDKVPPIVRLDKTDAVFVDVIHTNGQKFNGMMKGFGLMKESGHVDFYVNGGKTQPGCVDGAGGLWRGFTQAIFRDGEFMKDMGKAVTCSHSRAHKIFIESMTSACKFKSFPCESFDKFQRKECTSCGDKGCSEAGYNAINHPQARGDHYVTTFDKAPFCGEHYYHLHIKHASFMKGTKGNIELQLKGNNGQITRAFSVFGGNTKKIGDKDFNTMMVLDKSEADLGGVKSVLGRYERKTAAISWFSTSAKKLTLRGLEITEVETGQKLFTKKYFEVADLTLKTGKTQSISVDIAPNDTPQS